MNKRLYIPTTILLVALLLSGCGFQLVTGSGRMATENRSVSGYDSIVLAGIGNIYLTQGETESVRIEAEDNLIPYFETSVVGTTLKIGIKDQYMGISLRPTQPVKFYVTAINIQAVTLAGSGNIFSGDIQTASCRISLLGSGDMSTDSLTATGLDINLGGSGNISLGSVSANDVNAAIAGSGDIRIDTLTAKTLSSKTAGSGNITVSGKVSSQTAEILGSGDYRAANLQSETVSLRVAGSGNSQVSASQTLNVTVLGSGDVVYSGSPQVSATIAGSGNVKQASQ
jgi:hypothetical protein